ncbi:unnamed protein product, partial [Closterium sp. NIES-54]
MNRLTMPPFPSPLRRLLLSPLSAPSSHLRPILLPTLTAPSFPLPSSPPPPSHQPSFPPPSSPPPPSHHPSFPPLSSPPSPSQSTYLLHLTKPPFPVSSHLLSPCYLTSRHPPHPNPHTGHRTFHPPLTSPSLPHPYAPFLLPCLRSAGGMAL